VSVLFDDRVIKAVLGANELKELGIIRLREPVGSVVESPDQNEIQSYDQQDDDE
jgi:hypothetical protein